MKPATLPIAPTPCAARRQRGISLVEILVAMVLLAIGLLGLAGLQLRGIQVNQGSQYRSEAEIMAEDLADRMRADPADAQNFSPGAGGFYATYTPTPGQAGASAGSTLPAMQSWLGEVATLPAGTVASGGVVDASSALPAACQNALPCAQVLALSGGSKPTPIQIGIYWNDARAANGSIPKSTNQVGSYVMVAELSNAY